MPPLRQSFFIYNDLQKVNKKTTIELFQINLIYNNRSKSNSRHRTMSDTLCPTKYCRNNVRRNSLVIGLHVRQKTSS